MRGYAPPSLTRTAPPSSISWPTAASFPWPPAAPSPPFETVVDGIPMNGPTVLFNGAAIYDFPQKKYLVTAFFARLRPAARHGGRHRPAPGGCGAVPR